MDPQDTAVFKPQGRPQLGDSINIATRSVHAKLNKNILARFPLAVPPQSSNPSAYVTGLLHIAPVYLTFEALWQDILDTHGRQPQNAEPDPEAGENAVPESLTAPRFPCDPDYDKLAAPWKRIHSVLTDLYLPGLMRSESLLHDICCLTGWSRDVVEEEVRAVTRTGRLGAFVAHIKRSIDNHPHVLLAYAWVLYMALFSGGRFIRASLEEAGPSFWGETCDPVQPSDRTCSASLLPTHQQLSPSESPQPSTSDFPLAFFRFSTPQDGENLGTEFKRRLARAQHLLTPEEHDQIVREAICIFENMNLVVAQLDDLFAPPHSPSNTSITPNKPTNPTTATPTADDDGPSLFRTWTRGVASLGPRWGGGRTRIRDSVAVAKERGVRAAQAQALVAAARVGSGADDGGTRGARERYGHAHVHLGAEKLRTAEGTPIVGQVAAAGVAVAVGALRGEEEKEKEKKGLAKKTKTVRFGTEVSVREGEFGCPRTQQKQRGLEEEDAGSGGEGGVPGLMVWTLVLAVTMAGVVEGFRRAWM